MTRTKRILRIFIIILLTVTVTLDASNVYAHIKLQNKIADVLATDIKVYIEGNLIPAYYSMDNLYIEVGKLTYYGFDVTWDAKCRELEIKRNIKKSISPLKVSLDNMKVGTDIGDMLSTDIRTFVQPFEIKAAVFNNSVVMNVEYLKLFGTVQKDEKNRTVNIDLNDTTELKTDSFKNNELASYYGITNSGLSAFYNTTEDKDWVYHTKTYHFLYKTNKKTGKCITLTKMGFNEINIKDNSLYFTTQGDGRDKDGYWYDAIYKIKTDGKDLQRLYIGHPSSLRVINNWLYFVDYNNKDYTKKYVKRMRLDGSNLSTVTEIDPGHIGLQLYNWKYYYLKDEIDSTGRYSRYLYSMNFDGTDVKKNSDVQMSHMVIEDGWMYSLEDINADDGYYSGYNFYKTKIDGTEKILLIGKTYIGGMVVKDGWLYYVSMSENLKGDGHVVWKMKLDGSQRTQIGLTTVNGFMSVSGNWVFHAADGGGFEEIHRYNLDGTGFVRY